MIGPRLRVHVLIWTVITAISFYRLFLIPTGQGYLIDETRYRNSSPVMLDSMLRGDWGEALRLTFAQHGRPFAGVIGLIPAALQRVSGGNESAVSLWNVLITAGILWFVYAILLLYVPSRIYAAAGAAIFALIHENSLFIRHMLPYDWALFIILGTAYYILSRKTRFRRWQAVICGILGGLAFSTYPGYYPLVVLLACLTALHGPPCLLNLIRFVFGFVLVIASLEAVSALVGPSNARWLFGLSSSVTQGDFSEGYSFAVSYLHASEGIYGLMLLVLFALAIPLCVAHRDVDLRVRGMVVLALLAYLGYGTLGVVFKYQVQYGRLIHMYLPFLVMGGALTLISIPRAVLQRAAWIALLVIGAITFAANAALYLPQRYPAEVAAAHDAHAYPGQTICPVIANERWQEQVRPECEIITVNLAYFIEEVSDWLPSGPFAAPLDWEAILTAAHPTAYAPYRYTGYTIAQRAALERFPPMMGVYRVRR